jgi:DNA-binding MarR family transcriptional regulator
MSAETRAAGLRKIELRPLEPLDGALELMFYGWRGMTRDADAYLESLGLSRVHHRILFIVARRDELTVGELVGALGLTKQAVHRPMRQLLEAGYVRSERAAGRRRFKILELTERGAEVEREASGRERRVMADAFEESGPAAREAWLAVMAAVSRRA